MDNIIELLLNKSTLGESIFAKHYNYEYNHIIEYTKKFNPSSWAERKYIFINKLNEIPKCKICNNRTRYFKSSNRYMDTCCRECDKKLKSVSHKSYWANMSEEEKRHRIEQEAKIKEQKYGYKTPFANKNVKDKIKQTMINKYNVDNAFKIPEIKDKIKKYMDDNREIINSKISNTWSKLNKESIKNKREQTILEKYGVNNYAKTNLFKDLYNDKNYVKQLVKKNYNTRKENNTFNISKQEDSIYNVLLEKFPTILRQYKDERYPYSCDFYIPDLDLFIEFNGNWTHGSKPFDENDNECVTILNEWKSKSNSKYYQNAIHNWTVLDVTKRNIAKQNNLNYLEFFTMEEFNDWFKYI